VIGQSLLGIIVLLGVGWLLSENRRQLPWRVIVSALGLQFILAVTLLKVDAFRALFLALNEVVLALQTATRAGTSFVFGYLGGGSLPFTESYPGAAFVLGFQALPLILVIGALSALLYHWRILPIIVSGFAWGLRRVLGLGGAAGVGVAANVFVGMVEAPLLVRPYVARLSRADLFVVMTAGMATIAGTVMVLYATILANTVPDAMGHILTASLINAPGAVLMARLLVPPSPDDAVDAAAITLPRTTASAIDAITQGTLEGVKLLINVTAMLVVMVALVSLANAALSLLPDAQSAPLTLQRLLGWVMAPAAWLIGIPWDQAPVAGSLLGIKVVLNEFLAYADLAQTTDAVLSSRSRLILTYALCGFANFGSLGIMIGGLGTLAPDRRAEIAALGLKSILAGMLTTLLTAAIVAVLI
jgi:concentrative nucleoside transporter, CNT family